MLDIQTWSENFLEQIKAFFGERLYFVGLQGSYARGEATAESDIDMVVILDQLSYMDVFAYGGFLDTLPQREKICGFLSGKEDLLCWDTADLFQFYHDTQPLFGDLEIVAAKLDDEAVHRAIHRGVCDIYHGCVHNLLHEKSGEALRGLYKSASFVVQALYYEETGDYVGKMADLMRLVGQKEACILEIFGALKEGVEADLESMSFPLFYWAKDLMESEGKSECTES